MSDIDYWRECISEAASDCGANLDSEQLSTIARACSGAHEHYGMAYYSPPASDRLNEIEREHARKLKALQAEFDAYRDNAEGAVAKAIRQPHGTRVTIGEHGEVLRHGGRTEQIQ